MSSVDVIVPCYNYARFLRECVNSVLTQVGPAVRLLILDDASPDETPEVARGLVAEDSRVFYSRHTENKGHIRTYNEGVEWTSSRYYLLLSADDYLLPGALKRAVSMLDAHLNMGFVFGNAVERNESGLMVPVRPFAGGGMPAGDRIMKGLEFIGASPASNIVPTPTAVIRTAVQKDCGGYRAEFPHAGDMEMWFRLAVRGDVGFIDSDQAVKRRHGKNMSEAYFANKWFPDVQQRLEVLQHFFSESGRSFPDPDTARRNAFLALASEAVGFASSAFNDGDEPLSRKLADYALEISADVRTTRRWRNLAIKKVIGPKAWRALRAVWQRVSAR